MRNFQMLPSKDQGRSLVFDQKLTSSIYSANYSVDDMYKHSKLYAEIITGALGHRRIRIISSDITPISIDEKINEDGISVLDIVSQLNVIARVWE